MDQVRDLSQIGMGEDAAAIHVPPLMLCGDPERPLDEMHMSDDIILGQLSDLPFADHIHRLVACNSPQGAAHRTGPEPCCYALLYETVILLQNIVQIRIGPALAPLTQLTALLQLRNGWWIGGVPVDIDHTRPASARCATAPSAESAWRPPHPAWATA